MEFIVLISILLVALVYLHLSGNSLMFQPGIKHCKNLLIASVLLIACSEILPVFLGRTVLIRFLAIIIKIAIWVLVVIAYYKFFSGCYNIVYLKRMDTPDRQLREKIRSILLDVLERKDMTQEYKIFVKTGYSDSLIETVRQECKELEISTYSFNDKTKEKLEDLCEKLKY